MCYIKFRIFGSFGACSLPRFPLKLPMEVVACAIRPRVRVSHTNIHTTQLGFAFVFSCLQEEQRLYIHFPENGRLYVFPSVCTSFLFIWSWPALSVLSGCFLLVWSRWMYVSWRQILFWRRKPSVCFLWPYL